jgi:leucyl-tRNA synthetase
VAEARQLFKEAAVLLPSKPAAAPQAGLRFVKKVLENLEEDLEDPPIDPTLLEALRLFTEGVREFAIAIAKSQSVVQASAMPARRDGPRFIANNNAETQQQKERRRCRHLRQHMGKLLLELAKLVARVAPHLPKRLTLEAPTETLEEAAVPGQIEATTEEAAVSNSVSVSVSVEAVEASKDAVHSEPEAAADHDATKPSSSFFSGWFF